MTWRMASAIKGAGYPYNLIFMRDLFSCRMYTNLSELWEGWTKNMYAGMRYSLVNLAVVMLFVTWMSLVPYLLLAWGLYSGSAEWTAWGGGISAVVQLVRLWLDIQVGQDPKYGPPAVRGRAPRVAGPSGIREGGRREGRQVPSSSTRIRTTWAATRRRHSGRGTQN